MYPACNTPVRVGEVAQFMGNDGANLVDRQCGQERIAHRERVHRPEHGGTRNLQRARIVDAGHNDAMHVRSADALRNGLRLAIERGAKLRRHFDAVRLWNCEPQRAKGAGRRDDNRHANQNSDDGDGGPSRQQSPDEGCRRR
jgi:hypothetical protein